MRCGSYFCSQLQALHVDLVKFLLTILGSPLQGVKNASGTKAQLVKALKSMLTDVNYGEQVRSGLVWNFMRYVNE